MIIDVFFTVLIAVMNAISSLFQVLAWVLPDWDVLGISTLVNFAAWFVGIAGDAGDQLLVIMVWWFPFAWSVFLLKVAFKAVSIPYRIFTGRY